MAASVLWLFPEVCCVGLPCLVVAIPGHIYFLSYSDIAQKASYIKELCDFNYFNFRKLPGVIKNYSIGYASVGFTELKSLSVSHFI